MNNSNIIKCPKCEAEIECVPGRKNAFCNKCGSPLAADDSAAANVVAKPSKNKLKFVLPVIVLLIVLAGIGIYYISPYKHKSDECKLEHRKIEKTGVKTDYLLEYLEDEDPFSDMDPHLSTVSQRYKSAVLLGDSTSEYSIRCVNYYDIHTSREDFEDCYEVVDDLRKKDFKGYYDCYADSKHFDKGYIVLDGTPKKDIGFLKAGNYYYGVILINGNQYTEILYKGSHFDKSKTRYIDYLLDEMEIF